MDNIPLKFFVMMVLLMSASYSVDASMAPSRHTEAGWSYGDDDKNEPSLSNNKGSETERWQPDGIGLLVDRSQLQVEIDSLKSGNSQLKSENESLKSGNSQLNAEIKRLKAKRSWPWIVLAFVVGCLSVFLLSLICIRSPKSNVTASPHLGNGLPKCPRCGMEHDPGDTVCKNPKCKTQF